ncbi:hypothetical protein DFH27DRAFT_318487 [Peziza echinospora]|nr:hypothetical protein DFH27DRAFT_318487 [Peziza echinospora]
MPSGLASPVLSVSITDIAKVDTTNVDNLFTMWTIFSKCADSLEHGRRLENLSWRLWNRETFCCETVPENQTNSSTVAAIDTRSTRRELENTYADMPALSESVDSVSSDCSPSHPDGRTQSIHISRPQFMRQESCRGREKHMTPVHLAKLVDGMRSDDILTHKAQSVPLSLASAQACAPQALTMPTKSTPELTLATSEESTHSIVRGFSPAHISSSIRSPQPEPVATKKGMWIIGSTSSDGSSCMESYPAYRTQQPEQRKRTSFKEEVITKTVYDDDEDDEYTTEDDVDESAIEDDESDWDSVSESVSSSYEQRNMFARVQEKTQLPSRRSLLSTLLHEPSRATHLAGSRSTPALRSRTHSPEGPSVAPSPSHDSPISLLGGMRIAPRPLMATTTIHPPALSPRTTRRNMLATELTESLRQNLLWERKQKDTTVIKRRHTAHTEMSKLTEYPQVSNMSGTETSKTNSWNHFFEVPNEYHTKGW